MNGRCNDPCTSCRIAQIKSCGLRWARWRSKKTDMSCAACRCRSQSIRNPLNTKRNLGVKKKLKGKQQLLGDAYSFPRGETSQAVLKAKVHFIEDAEMNDAEIPAKPAYVPIEGSLGIAPAISTSAVVGSCSLKGMAFVQLFKLERDNGKFVDWEWFQATIKKAARRAADNHHIITGKCDLEKDVRDIDVDDGKQYEVRTIASIDYDYSGRFVLSCFVRLTGFSS